MSRGKGHVPVRTCVSCGAKGSKKEMLRFVLDEDMHLLRDDSGRRAGRGSYTCKGSSCVENLMNRRNVGALFRVSRGQGKKSERPQNNTRLVGVENSKDLGGVNGESQGL
ncbi:MAG: YlxR family protein [Deltaproteobacteria bacterium]